MMTAPCLHFVSLSYQKSFPSTRAIERWGGGGEAARKREARGREAEEARVSE